MIASLQARVATFPNTDFSGDFLYVDIEKQCLYHFRNWELQESFPVSTAKLGAGQRSGSNQTPTGLHVVASRYGEGLPKGAILRGRKFTGKIASIYTDKTNVEEDDVTTRILWLKGLEPGYNAGKSASGIGVDSYKRYIYIHGTPEEGLIGTPQSHGCVRMTNEGVIRLFDSIAVGTPVLILPSLGVDK